MHLLATAIRIYKREHGYFPKTLEDVNKTTYITDNSYILIEGTTEMPLYYYEIIDSSDFILLGISRDGIPKTEDDLLPSEN